MRRLLFLLPLLLYGCSSSDDNTIDSKHFLHAKGEYIFRKHNEYFYAPPSPKEKPPPHYPWENNHNLPLITKDFFRCRGSATNPEKIIEQSGELKTLYDCEGEDAHGLPLRNGKEFIFPILLNLLNYLQETTGKKVLITSGHRCPAHNTYIDPSKENLYSKHMIGGEVSFYLQGMERTPQEVIQLLLNYYENDSESDYRSFSRYQKQNTNVRTPPWYNKEIFIKLFASDEGRNLDNTHQYPYISIQVRYDREQEERVAYSWKKANRELLRK